MAYTITETKAVVRALETLPKKIRASYEKWRDNDLTNDPENAGEGVLVKLRHESGAVIRKKRFGSIRVLYIVAKEKVSVLVFKMEKREKVYDF